MSRFWVAGGGDWSDNTNHWASVSGGTPGASLPGSSDNVVIDDQSGLSGDTIVLDVNAACADFTSNSGLSYTIDGSGGGCVLRIYGSATLEAGITFATGTDLVFASTDVGKIITTDGVVLNAVTFESEGGGWKLQDDLSMLGNFAQSNGTFDANGHNITANAFIFTSDSASYATNIIMGSGTWKAIGHDTGRSWFVETYLNTRLVNFTPERSTIEINNSAISTQVQEFWGGGKIYNDIVLTGTHSYTVDGVYFFMMDSSTFNRFKVTHPPQQVRFLNTTTQAVTRFVAMGTAGNLITLIGDPGT